MLFSSNQAGLFQREKPGTRAGSWGCSAQGAQKQEKLLQPPGHLLCRGAPRQLQHAQGKALLQGVLGHPGTSRACSSVPSWLRNLRSSKTSKGQRAGRGEAPELVPPELSQHHPALAGSGGPVSGRQIATRSICDSAQPSAHILHAQHSPLRPLLSTSSPLLLASPQLLPPSLPRSQTSYSKTCTRLQQGAVSSLGAPRTRSPSPFPWPSRRRGHPGSRTGMNMG